MSKRIKPIWDKRGGGMDEKSPNKTFCMAPWTHTYISPQSERRLCCASREEHSFQKQYIDASNDERYGEVTDSTDDYNPVTLKEYWNSPHIKSVRKRMMAGETLPECDVCNEEILSLSTYRHWFTGVLFPGYIDKAFETTDDDGHTTMETISFDYRLDNKCNFKCRMCGDLLSSSWEVENKSDGYWVPENDPWLIDENREKIKKFTKDTVEEEFLDAVNRGIVEEIYWVGGEPLSWPIHWKVMKQMVVENTSKKCFIRYNSNLWRIKYHGSDLCELLPHFKDWLMCASIDSIGKIGEFIRTGLVWDKFDENYRRLQKVAPDKILLDLTITGPGMFGLKDLFDYSIELDTRIETKIMFAFHPDIIFSPFAWPKEILHEKIDELLKYIEPRATQKQQTLVNTLHNMKKRPTFAEQWPEIYEQKFFDGRNHHERLKKLRGDGTNGKLTIEDIYKNHEGLFEWWMRPNPIDKSVPNYPVK
jgi:hypothetical protein|tara:strand:+ start:1833 stop:3260 length:1428 start_codon:yes stop_codon:yes gene_type:complete